MKKVKKCVGCGGDLIFSPLSQSLKCEKCSKEQKIDFVKDYPKHTLTNDILNQSKNIERVDINNANCPSCGASVNVKGLEFTAICPFCDSPIILENNIKNFEIDAIIPFSIDKTKVFEIYKEKIKKKWFLPNAFKKDTKIAKIDGFYIPAFGFDCDTFSSYSGILEETRRDHDGNTYTTRKSISGNKTVIFENEVVESSTRLNQNDIDAVLPYNFNDSVKYDSDFIRGYSVEHFNNTLENCFKLSRISIDNKIKSQILSRYNYTSVVKLDVQTTYSNEKYCYHLLPVYKLDFNYKQKDYSTFMNGQTGKVGTGLPKSKVKITFFVLGIIAIFVGIFLLCAFAD